MVENKYLVNNKISSQYFVIYPLLAMTEVKRFSVSLHKVFTQNLTIHGPIHYFLYTDQSSWSLCRKTAPKHSGTPNEPEADTLSRLMFLKVNSKIP